MASQIQNKNMSSSKTVKEVQAQVEVQALLKSDNLFKKKLLKYSLKIKEYFNKTPIIKSLDTPTPGDEIKEYTLKEFIESLDTPSTEDKIFEDSSKEYFNNKTMESLDTPSTEDKIFEDSSMEYFNNKTMESLDTPSTEDKIFEDSSMEYFNKTMESLDTPSTEDKIFEDRNLADFVFRYYRHRFVEEIKSDNTILLHESFQLLHLIYENRDNIEIHLKRWISLIVASTQQGKTFLMFALANIFLALGYCPVFIVKDIYQKNQFISRKAEDSKDLQNFLRVQKFSEANIDIFGETLYQDSTFSKQDVISINNNIEASLNGTRRRMIVCIWNALHIKRVYQNIQPNSKIALFVDEAHKLGAYKRITPDVKDQDTESTGNIKCDYDNIYLKLKVHADKIFLFTATPQAIIATESDLYMESIVIMPEGVNYRGIETWDFSVIPEDKDDVYLEKYCESKAGKKEIVYIPSSFLKNIASLSDKPMIRRTNKFSIEDYHPINVMAKFEITNNGQRVILDCFKPDTKALNEDHQKIIDGKWTVMTLNQEGIRLYNHALVGRVINIRDKSYKCNDKGECLLPKSVAVGDIWHWLWLNDISNFGRIITIGYKSAEEGLTFCSSWGTTPKSDGNIHLTHFYSHAGNNISAASLEQSTGRMNGNHGDKMSQPPLVFCPLSEKEKLLKSVNLHRKMLKDICEMKLLYNDGRVINYIHGYEIFTNLVPNKYYGDIKGVSKSIKKKPNPMANMENDAFKANTNAFDIMAIINPDLDGGKKRNLEIEFHNELNNAISNMDVKENENILSGNIIDPPIRGGKNLEQYNAIVSFLENNRNKWIPLTDIRRHFSLYKYNICLHDKRNDKYGSSGLIWRQKNGLNTAIEYALI